MSESGFFGVLAVAALEGALVALPRADALQRLAKLRSPAWAAVLPGSIVLGTFGVLALPRMAFGLLLAASIATPLFAAAGVVALLRRTSSGLLPALFGLILLVGPRSGWEGQISSSVVTALGCLALGIALVRLIPARWIGAAIVSMCALDVLFLGLGIGQPAGALIAGAREQFHGPLFNQASFGPISIDYVDLVLAAVLGAIFAGHRLQRRGAALLALLAAAYGLLLPIAHSLPATLPIAVTFAVLCLAGGLPGRVDTRGLQRCPAA
jgi:hypothetical protein